jgi:hypothetical protein
LRPWEDWEKLPLTAKENLLAYNQIREVEEVQMATIGMMKK